MKPVVKWAFAGSLVVNIFLIGLISGRMTQPHLPPLPGGPPPGFERLPAEKREMAERMMKRLHEQRENDFKAMEKTREEIIEILEAPIFDEEKFLTKSNELEAFFSRSKQQMIAETAALAKNFSQKERRVLADRLRKPPAPPMGGPQGMPGMRPPAGGPPSLPPHPKGGDMPQNATTPPPPMGE